MEQKHCHAGERPEQGAGSVGVVGLSTTLSSAAIITSDSMDSTLCRVQQGNLTKQVSVSPSHQPEPSVQASSSIGCRKMACRSEVENCQQSYANAHSYCAGNEKCAEQHVLHLPCIHQSCCRSSRRFRSLCTAWGQGFRLHTSVLSFALHHYITANAKTMYSHIQANQAMCPTPTSTTHCHTRTHPLLALAGHTLLAGVALAVATGIDLNRVAKVVALQAILIHLALGLFRRAHLWVLYAAQAEHAGGFGGCNMVREGVRGGSRACGFVNK